MGIMNFRPALLAGLWLIACRAEDKGTTVQLDGPYEASSGPIAEITFLDSTRYSLVASPCTGDPSACVHQGTYALNSDHDVLSLTDDATGDTNKLPFQIDDGVSISAPLSIENAPSTTPLVTGTSDTPLIVPPGGVNLVGSFSVDLVTFKARQFQMHPGHERIAYHNEWIQRATSQAAQQASLDWLNAYWLARMSQFAYLSQDDLVQALTRVGLSTDADHFQTFSNNTAKTFAFYISTASLSAAPAPITDSAAVAQNKPTSRKQRLRRTWRSWRFAGAYRPISKISWQTSTHGRTRSASLLGESFTRALPRYQVPLDADRPLSEPASPSRSHFR